MQFENFTINKAIIHEIFRRDDNKQLVPPAFGAQLIALGADGTEVLQDRIVSALASSAHCMEMAIQNSQIGSAFEISTALMASTDAEFILRSQALATSLATAQTSRQYPGGIVVVFSGTVGNPALPVLGVIKAEVHNGFTRENAPNGALLLKFLRNLLLTPQTKLYKIGVFVRFNTVLPAPGNLAAGYRAFVYDDLMQQSNRQSAAQYFYGGFLGCAFLSTSSLLTKNFHTFTKKFITDLQIPEEEKIDLYTGLYTYLKVDQRPTIETTMFANTYFADAATKDAYLNHMAENGVMPVAIHKDLSDLSSELRFRKVTFGSDIKLTAPADKFDELIQLTVEQGPPDPQNGQIPTFTVVKIKSRIQRQE